MRTTPIQRSLTDLMEPAHARIATTLAEVCGVPPELAPQIAFRVLRDICQDPQAVTSIRAVVRHGAGSVGDNPPLDALPRLVAVVGSAGGRRG